MSDDLNNNNDALDDDIEFEKSKSQVKREMTALQDLGAALVQISEKDLAKIPMPERLEDSVRIARKINRTSHSGLRRQLQFIGKLMRSIEVEPIQAAYDEVINGQQQQTRAFQQLEQLRDELIAQGDKAAQSVLDQHPQADRQHLRQLIRAAQKEQQTKTDKQPKSKGAGKKLFAYLRELAEV